jgi:hypothetical protein
MIAKGLIEMCSDGRGGTGYSIRPAGKAALKAKFQTALEAVDAIATGRLLRHQTQGRY